MAGAFSVYIKPRRLSVSREERRDGGFLRAERPRRPFPRLPGERPTRLVVGFSTFRKPRHPSDVSGEMAGAAVFYALKSRATHPTFREKWRWFSTRRKAALSFPEGFGRRTARLVVGFLRLKKPCHPSDVSGEMAGAVAVFYALKSRAVLSRGFRERDGAASY